MTVPYWIATHRDIVSQSENEFLMRSSPADVFVKYWIHSRLFSSHPAVWSLRECVIRRRSLVRSSSDLGQHCHRQKQKIQNWKLYHEMNCDLVLKTGKSVLEADCCVTEPHMTSTLPAFRSKRWVCVGSLRWESSRLRLTRTRSVGDISGNLEKSFLERATRTLYEKV